MGTLAKTLSGRRRISTLIALLFAVMWVPMASHDLLELAEWIHHEADADHPGAAHESADGFVRIYSSKVSVKEPPVLALDHFVVPTATTSANLLRGSQVVLPVRRETESPPGMVESWPFALRLALPGRAPSFAV